MDYKELCNKEATRFEKATKDIIATIEKLFEQTTLDFDKEKVLQEMKQTKNYLQTFDYNIIEVHTNLTNAMLFVEANKFSDNKMVVVESNKQIVTNLDKFIVQLAKSIDYLAHKIKELAVELDELLENDTICDKKECDCEHCQH